MSKSNAIEVLKSEKVLYIEKIKEIESRFNGMPFDIKESYQKSVKVYQEFIDALGEAIVALEKQEELKEFISGKITDLEMKLGLNEDVESKDLKDLYKLLQNSLVIEKQIEVLKEVLGKVGEQK